MPGYYQAVPPEAGLDSREFEALLFGRWNWTVLAGKDNASWSGRERLANPRLLHATPKQRMNWKIAGGGYGIHWPELAEDLSTEGLLRGAPAPRRAR